MDLATHLFKTGVAMNRAYAESLRDDRDPWVLKVGESVIGVYDTISEAREIAGLLIGNSSSVWHLAQSADQCGPFVWRSQDGAVMRLERRRA